MINATHYVVDLETMGKGPKAAIVSIGCVRVDHGRIAGGFYGRVLLESSLSAGLEMDASTVQWWLQQSDSARAEVDGSTPTNTYPLDEILQKLAAFMGHYEDGVPDDSILVWGNGSSFDNVILASAYNACDLQRPWHFRNDRDMRTLLAIFPEAKEAVEFEGTRHHAYDDARHKARQLCYALKLMKVTQAAGEA